MQAVAGGIGTSQPSLGVMRAVASSATPGRPGRCCIAVVGRTPVRLPAPCIVWFVAVAMANLCSQPSHSLLGNVLQQYKISQKRDARTGPDLHRGGRSQTHCPCCMPTGGLQRALDGSRSSASVPWPVSSMSQHGTTCTLRRRRRSSRCCTPAWSALSCSTSWRHMPDRTGRRGLSQSSWPRLCQRRQRVCGNVCTFQQHQRVGVKSTTGAACCNVPMSLYSLRVIRLMSP